MDDKGHDALEAPAVIEKLAEDLGGTIEDAGRLPDGSGFAVMSMPLPDDHWIYEDKEGFSVPPMPMRMGTSDPRRQKRNEQVKAAARYAVKAATMDGKEMDFDPDALVQNMVVGLLGYHTPDGLSSDEWANPPEEVAIEKAKTK